MLAKEARTNIYAAALGVAVLTYFIGVWAIPLWLIVAVFAFTWRSFPRVVPSIPLANVSPVDGGVIAVEHTHDPYLKRDALRVTVRQWRLGEFSVYSPIEGKLIERWFAAKGDTMGGPLFAMHIRTDEDDDVVVAFSIASRFRYMRMRRYSGERVGQGRRIGFFGFGCSVDVYLPASSRANVAPGQRVRGGSDVIGTFIHPG